ncbi:XdhC family protein [Herbaspirillum sp. RV1423]|uniref:XdhC family protein n=1 Tax=Herbaspirillum sp. RV1423 TaxID=1443993 RepID=UPI0006875421|nr:XdhC family protein [Herbaspirillum sp. RV1423]
MESMDLQVLRTVRAWCAEGYAARLFTVAQTWGSAPRPPGAMVAVRSDGMVAGSVSGGCVEDDLIERVRRDGAAAVAPSMVSYGVTRENAARFGLPCGGTLQLVQESVSDPGWLEEVLAAIEAHGRVCRRLDMDTGAVAIQGVADGLDMRRPQLDDDAFTTWYGPRWRLLMIGAGQLSQVLAGMALALDYEVLVCDPREEYADGWQIAGARRLAGMPDDVVAEIRPDPHTAIVALTHDPKLDDMALLEALKSPAFYVGALGSKRNSERRRERLAMFDLGPGQIARLHAPIGMAIGSRLPAEIAVSVLAEMTAVKNAGLGAAGQGQAAAERGGVPGRGCRSDCRHA